jgi:Protein of unknown function (DUF3800)
MSRAPIQLPHPQITQRVFVYLTYIDDSDTKANQQQWQVLGAVLIPDSSFLMLEVISSHVIRDLMTEERYEEFTEFHACELYGGYGIFEGINQAKRFEAIEMMLAGLLLLGAKVAYGAIDLEHLKRQPYASANPVDVAFRMCADGIEEFLRQKIADTARGTESDKGPSAIFIDGGSSAIFIADVCDKAVKAILQKSFRSLRPRFRPSEADFSKFAFVHDDMYFGDSRYSLGIQMADLCSYFIARHLAGDAETEH